MTELEAAVQETIRRNTSPGTPANSVNVEAMPEPVAPKATRPPKAFAAELHGTFAVLRLEGIVDGPDGSRVCTCGDSPCENKPGKHPPKGTRGVYSVAKSIEEIEAWPDTANYGIRTSAEFGYGVLDIDVRKLGHETLAKFEAELGALPPTVTTITGGVPVDGHEGEHRHFLLSDTAKGRHYKPKPGEGIDFQTDGKYVVGPGSVHESGRLYRWAPGRSPSEIPFAVLPEAWADALAQPAPAVHTEGLEDDATPDEVEAAEKHLTNYRKKRAQSANGGNNDRYAACAILRHDWALSVEHAFPILKRHNEAVGASRDDSKLLAMLEREDVGGVGGGSPRGHARARFREERDDLSTGANLSASGARCSRLSLRGSKPRTITRPARLPTRALTTPYRVVVETVAKGPTAAQPCLGKTGRTSSRVFKTPSMRPGAQTRQSLTSLVLIPSYSFSRTSSSRLRPAKNGKITKRKNLQTPRSRNRGGR